MKITILRKPYDKFEVKKDSYTENFYVQIGKGETESTFQARILDESSSLILQSVDLDFTRCWKKVAMMLKP